MRPRITFAGAFASLVAVATVVVVRAGGASMAGAHAAVMRTARKSGRRSDMRALVPPSRARREAARDEGIGLARKSRSPLRVRGRCESHRPAAHDPPTDRRYWMPT